MPPTPTWSYRWPASARCCSSPRWPDGSPTVRSPPDQPVDLLDSDRQVGGTGLLGLLSPRQYTVADLATAVAAVSDNAATNGLLRLVTLDAVQDLARRIGLRDTTVHDRLRAARGDDVPATFATGTARELCAFLAEVATGNWQRPQRPACCAGGSPATPIAPSSPTPSATTPGRPTASG
ncbi:serine hydrolase [Micromonospora sp. ATA32]|nr:serine hydrolase [Micromonospora sp. ATA32]